MASVQLRENTQPLVTLEPSISSNRQQNEVVLTKSDGEEAMQPEQDEMLVPALGIRDAGVSDEVWEQLQRDRAEEDRQEQDYRKLKEAQKSARAADRDRIVRQLIEEEQRRREEAAKRAKLTQMGACPIGFQWIKQTGGYRCAGGSHYMSDDEVSRL